MIDTYLYIEENSPYSIKDFSQDELDFIDKNLNIIKSKNIFIKPGFDKKTFIDNNKVKIKLNI